MVQFAPGFDFISALTLVVALLTLLYLANYTLILYGQKRRGRVRWDWSMSVIFYAGIGLFALSYVFRHIDFCSGKCPPAYFDFMDLLALLLFLWGFKKRADTSETIEVSAHEIAAQKRKKRNN